MTAAVARAVMALASCCLGASRREWSLAMRGEFEEAVAAGRPLAFAGGCLVAAWREMPRHAEGRLVVATYALALGLLIPMAVLQFARAIGFSYSFLEGGVPEGMLLPGATPNPYFAWSQFSGVPGLLLLWVSLGLGHLRLAWALVDRDWSGVVKVGALIGAVTITLFIFMSVLLLDVTTLLSQAALLTIELAAILAAARWHARLSPNGGPEVSAR